MKLQSVLDGRIVVRQEVIVKPNFNAAVPEKV
jgi:hypothetical protein